MRTLLAVSALLLALAGCGTQDDDVDKAPTGAKAAPSSMKEACPAIADAILGTSPTAADQVQALAATLDGIADDGDAKVRSALRSLPVDLRTLAGNLGSADLATKYAADVADVAKACAASGSPFPTS